MTAPVTPAGAEMLANRLKKNSKHLKRWLQRHAVHCYRLYDADIPEYAMAVDVYEGDKRWVHMQEYEAPAHVDTAVASARLRQAVAVVGDALQVPETQIYVKVRRQQKGSSQYQKLADRGDFHQVIEGGWRFHVNFTDYLDTGLFLDHRITRSMLAEWAEGRHFLNLFAYTGSATVYAAGGNARSTTTVDMSKTYLQWSKRNMSLNGFIDSRHRYEQVDCLTWLAAAAKFHNRRYGLIFLDPPSFSSSKRMRITFDVQRDHVMLIQQAAGLLDDNGLLVFSNNRRRFKMDKEALVGYGIEDISRQTLPKDFERHPTIHGCWKIRVNAQRHIGGDKFKKG